jgi:hypothetical protein
MNPLPFTFGVVLPLDFFVYWEPLLAITSFGNPLTKQFFKKIV